VFHEIDQAFQKSLKDLLFYLEEHILFVPFQASCKTYFYIPLFSFVMEYILNHFEYMTKILRILKLYLYNYNLKLSIFRTILKVMNIFKVWKVLNEYSLFIT